MINLEGGGGKRRRIHANAPDLDEVETEQHTVSSATGRFQFAWRFHPTSSVRIAAIPQLQSVQRRRQSKKHD